MRLGLRQLGWAVLGFCLVVGLVWGQGEVMQGREATVDPVTAISWGDTAIAYRGQGGDRTFYCPAQGQLGPLWGSDVYSDDSSICTAAVHGGLITVADGGAIAIRLLLGTINYPATTQNEVSSAPKPASLGSFTFTTLHDPIAGVVEVDGDRVPIQVTPWSGTALPYYGRQGEAIALYCPPNGAIAEVWGDQPYRDASSICTAAVHAHQITAAAGGTVAIKILPGHADYAGSSQQGITSLSFGESAGSFEFVPYKPWP
ncbi:MAG: LCCL domain-containing protein [Leptolyngbyaceae bacterium]|nr:LCCL domain-containing protein [Leptolyngbyaceae bacterium]